MKKFLLLAVVVGGAWYYLHQPAAAWRGMPAPRDPIQTAPAVPATFERAGVTFTPLASYHVSAVVLSRCRYRYDRSSDLAPVDLALGWGPMSVASTINDLEISQSGRWYEYSWRNEPPLDPSSIATHSANTHCLPANDAIRHDLLTVKRHDLVTLDGYLVDVRAPDGFRWHSSLSRDDTGGGSCEVLWVTSVHRQHL